jgi:multidrug efflux pump subunit AcrA (membrane-fusion protein)
MLRQKFRSAILVLLILGGAVAAFIYMKSTKPKQPPVQVTEKVWPVEAIEAHKSALRPIYTLYGNVETPDKVTIKTPIGGQVATVAVKAGDFVEKGALLVALSEMDRQLPVTKAQAQLEQAQAQLTLQELADEANRQKLKQEEEVLKLKAQAVERAKQLMQKNLASQAALDQAQEAYVRQQSAVTATRLAVKQQRARLAQLQANVASAKAALEEAQLNTQRAYVTAPEVVLITQVSVAQGDQVSPNAPLVSYYAPQSLEVRTQVPITLFPKLQAQFLAELPVTARVPSRGLSLTLNRFAAQAQTASVDAYFHFSAQNDNKKGAENLKNARIPSPAPALAGELLTMNVQLAPEADSFAVPYTALFGNDKVYVVRDERLQRVKVDLLGDVLVKGERWALLKGDVKEGDAIMTTHLPNAITGLKVKVTKTVEAAL